MVDKFSLVRDTIKVLDAYVDNVVPDKHCDDVAFRLVQMLYSRLERLEELCK